MAAEAETELSISRIIDAAPPLVWRAWTECEYLRQWWAPSPLTIPECEIDLRPGGLFRTLMRAPDGTEYPTRGIWLEVVGNERLVFTDALDTGYRPAQNPFFTAIVTFAEEAGKTRYTARALHKDAADRDKHEQMGFHEGWGRCLDQLVGLVARMKTNT